MVVARGCLEDLERGANGRHTEKEEAKKGGGV